MKIGRRRGAVGQSVHVHASARFLEAARGLRSRRPHKRRNRARWAGENEDAPHRVRDRWRSSADRRRRAAQSAVPAANAADTAWMLTATALVLFMTLPGLALFYAGLVRAKNVLSVMMHCVAIACLASVLWLVGGYSLAFSGHGVPDRRPRQVRAAWRSRAQPGRDACPRPCSSCSR